jgi:hypothetical protein
MLSIFLAAAVAAGPAGDWSRFETRLRGGESATVLLQAWCDRDPDGAAAKVQALRGPGQSKAPDREVRRRLGAAPGERVVYRHVELACAGRVLSRADNWYLPDRLTAAMNQTLETTDTPFGAVVRPLGFTRRIVLLSDARGDLRKGESLRVRAVLVDGAGRPFSLVDERYADVLKAPIDRPRSGP